MGLVVWKKQSSKMKGEMTMINRDRIVNEFMELVRIDSISKKESKMVEVLKAKLSELGYETFVDDAGSKIDGETGNIICNVKGSKDTPALLLMAHMDTVLPGIGKNPILKDGYIVSDGKTILGGDDAAGIVTILESLRVLKEDNLPHCDLQIVFTVAEEVGLLGAKNLDYAKIHSQYGLVLDCGGAIGTVAAQAPSQNMMNIIVKGKAAHAGIEPEKGISAIQIAAKAISEMQLGRIDNETTANVGIINGGLATNIICERLEISAEARSRSQEKLEAQTLHMKECFEKAAEIYGGSVEFNSSLEYMTFDIKDDSKLISMIKKASSASGIELKVTSTGGGSDTNIINQKGIEAVAVSVGMDKVHSIDERILIEDLVNAVKLLVEIIKNIE